MFKRLSSAFSSLYSSFFARKFDDESLQHLQKILVESDTGVATSQKIIETLKLSHETDPRKALNETLTTLLEQALYAGDGSIIILVGINGGGKTTSAAKLAHFFKKKDERILIAAADTFRAAAVEQLKRWAELLQVPLIAGGDHQDPSAVVYQACMEFKKGNYDKLIIDTAGRLQTKAHLMKELEKIHRTISKQLPEKSISTLLVIDSMLGQNSLEQAKLFNESTTIDGIILTKTDGTGKGGMVLSIVDRLKIPIAYVTFGEDIKDIDTFNHINFVAKIIGSA